MKKYKVAYATGSRADWGIVKNYLKLLNSDKSIDFSVLVTGSHLENKFGHSVDIIRQDGFKIDFEAPLGLNDTSECSIIKAVSKALSLFGEFFDKNKYDLLIILGDRYEMFAVAAAAAMQKIPILHLHGGEVTYGNYDEFIRHSITKMSLYHFTSTEAYRNRVLRLGESPERVFALGALGAQNCTEIEIGKVDERLKKFKPKKYFVISFHPETLTDNSPENQISELLTALKGFENNYDLVFIGTNADTGSDKIRNAVNDFASARKNTSYFENLNVDSYLYLVKNSALLIGNSSSGIIEAPSLGVYSVNIGDRQKGRERGNSVLDTKCVCNDIKNTIANALELSLKGEKINNPYYTENCLQNYYNKTLEILRENRNTVKYFYDYPGEGK